MSDNTVWKNRIVGHGSKPASQFQAHPHNWRKHPQNQRKAVRGSLDSLGWIATVIENITTGRLIDGHERVWNALQNGDADVPFIQVELTEAEEAQALLSLDAISALAETDREQVNALLEQVNTDNADVMQFLTDFSDSLNLNVFPEGHDNIEGMELLPDEKYDYVLLAFTKRSDFEEAINILNLKKLRDPRTGWGQHVGLCRVIDGKPIIKKIQNENYYTK
jgi:hypothetical protein